MAVPQEKEIEVLDKIFSISEAAEYVGVFTLTLRNWEKSGKIKSFRTLGGHRRFKRSELDKIINSDQNNTAHLKLNSVIDELKNISKRIK